MGLDVRVGLQSYYKCWVSALNVNIKAPKVINITVQESPEVDLVWVACLTAERWLSEG